MNDIFKIVMFASQKNEVMNTSDLKKILSILIDEKQLNNYILSADVQPIRSNKIASYSDSTKKILIYSNVINRMLYDISNNILLNDIFLETLYKNLCLLQIILHEVEHANQLKIKYDNTLESFILRISNLVAPEKQIYEITPKERFAEIKSYYDIFKIISFYDDEDVNKILSIDCLQRKLRGYHYTDGSIVSPLVEYFVSGQKNELLYSFEWYSDNKESWINKLMNNYTPEECMFYGFPIESSVYIDSMNELINGINSYFKNKIKIV